MPWNPVLYDRHHRFVADLATELVDLLAPRTGERVLDLGCGTGRLLEPLAARGAQVVGVDSDPAMVAAAQKRCPRAEVRQADARDLSALGCVDALLSNATLHWIPEAERAARSMAGVLRPGGRAVLELGGAGCVASVVRALPAALRHVGVGKVKLPWFFPGALQYRRVLRSAGFDRIQARLFPRPTPLEDGTRGLANWLRMFCGDLLAPLPKGAQQSVIAQVERDCEAHCWRDDHWELDYVRLRVVAQRAA